MKRVAIILVVMTMLLLAAVLTPANPSQITYAQNVPDVTNTPFNCAAAPNGDDQYEDDDSYQQAVANFRQLQVGANQFRTLCPFGDQDWAYSNLTAFNVYQYRTIDTGPLVSTTIAIYDARNPAFPVVTVQPAVGGTSLNFTPDTSGVYYVQITDVNGRGGNPDDYRYTLQLFLTGSVTATPTSSPTRTVTSTPTGVPATSTPTQAPFCRDPFEPDDTRDQAYLIRITESQRHAFCPESDKRDWVKFTGSAGSTYILQTSDLGVGVDTVITVYSPGGGAFISNDNFPGGGLASRVEFVAPLNGQYDVEVFNKDAGGSGSTYTVNLTSPGLIVPTGSPSSTASPVPSATPQPSPTACIDQYEDDGVPANAKELLVNSSQTHLFCPTSDADWVYFYARPGKIYRVITEASSGPAGLDTYLYIFDNDRRTILAQSDDFNGSLFAGLDFLPPRDTTYYLQLKNYGDVGGSSIAYRVSLVVAPIGSTPMAFAQTATAQAALGTATPGTAATFTAQALVPTFTQPAGSQPTNTTAPLASATAIPRSTLSVTVSGTQTATATATASSTPALTPSSTPTVGSTANGFPTIPIVPAFTQQPPVLPPLLPATGANLAQAGVVVNVYVDRNGNGAPDRGEGVSGLPISFYDAAGRLAASGRTDRSGYSTSTTILHAMHRVTVGYVGFARTLFAGVAPHEADSAASPRIQWDVRLPAPILPQRIP